MRRQGVEVQTLGHTNLFTKVLLDPVVENSENQVCKFAKIKSKLPMILIDEIEGTKAFKCKLCCEEFEQIFIDDQEHVWKGKMKINGKLKEGWYLKDAIRCDGNLIHPTCSNERR